jgi:hypothetical protein
VARQGPPPLTAEARETYLASRLPLYPAIAWLNRTRPDGYTVWALHAENMVYFAEGRFLGDWTGPASFERVLGAARDAASLHRELRKLGVTHLLVPTEDGAFMAQLDGRLRPRFQLVYQDPHARVYALGAPAPFQGARARLADATAALHGAKGPLHSAPSLAPPPGLWNAVTA